MKKIAFFFLLLATWLLLTWSVNPANDGVSDGSAPRPIIGMTRLTRNE